MYIWFTVLITAVQQSDSVIHVYLFFFHILFLYGLSQDIEYSSLCCTGGPRCLSQFPLCDVHATSIQLLSLVTTILS